MSQLYVIKYGVRTFITRSKETLQCFIDKNISNNKYRIKNYVIEERSDAIYQVSPEATNIFYYLWYTKKFSSFWESSEYQAKLSKIGLVTAVINLVENADWLD